MDDMDVRRWVKYGDIGQDMGFQLFQNSTCIHVIPQLHMNTYGMLQDIPSSGIETFRTIYKTGMHIQGALVVKVYCMIQAPGGQLSFYVTWELDGVNGLSSSHNHQGFKTERVMRYGYIYIHIYLMGITPYENHVHPPRTGCIIHISTRSLRTRNSTVNQPQAQAAGIGDH